jgi:hypothetical protein
MTAYIVDTHKFKIENKYKDSSYASYAMSDNYSWEPDNRYIMLHNEDAAYDYWYLRVEESGEFYEGLGISEETKFDMFKDWINN